MELLSILLALLASISFVTSSDELSLEQYETLLDEMETFFRNNGPHLPTAVRLAFHDCVGVCDGCINITDTHNAGLRDVVDALELEWKAYVAGDYPGLGRADFWALSSVAAINQGVRISNRKCASNGQ